MLIPYSSFAALSLIAAQVLMSPPHEPCVLQASMFVIQEWPFHVPIYAQKMAHALITSKPTQVLTPRFCEDPWVLKYSNIYASQDDFLVEHGLVDGNRNLASPLSLSWHLLVILLDLMPFPVARQTLISYPYFIFVFYYAWLSQL
jgi:hypothetical protein